MTINNDHLASYMYVASIQCTLKRCVAMLILLCGALPLGASYITVVQFSQIGDLYH